MPVAPDEMMSIQVELSRSVCSRTAVHRHPRTRLQRESFERVRVPLAAEHPPIHRCRGVSEVLQDCPFPVQRCSLEPDLGEPDIRPGGPGRSRRSRGSGRPRGPRQPCRSRRSCRPCGPSEPSGSGRSCRRQRGCRTEHQGRHENTGQSLRSRSSPNSRRTIGPGIVAFLGHRLFSLCIRLRSRNPRTPQGSVLVQQVRERDGSSASGASDTHAGSAPRLDTLRSYVAPTTFTTRTMPSCVCSRPSWVSMKQASTYMPGLASSVCC